MARVNKATKVMVIRHGEKPPKFGNGITDQGAPCDECLAVQGWQRAGALAALFDPSRGPLQDPHLAVPQFLFATAAPKSSSSERPGETLHPLADKLGLTINTGPATAPFTKNDYQAMIEAAVASEGVVLISWQHQDIPEIANLILQSDGIATGCWPGKRFDMVWVFDLDQDGTYKDLHQVPQLVLAKDSAQPIDTSKTAAAEA
jgi:hypothetical protein